MENGSNAGIYARLGFQDNAEIYFFTSYNLNQATAGNQVFSTHGSSAYKQYFNPNDVTHLTLSDGGSYNVDVTGTFRVSGVATLTTANTYSTGGYDVLVRNQTTNALEVTTLSGGTSYTADESTLHLASTVFSIKSTYPGQTSITTLGTIGTGTWQGTSISTTYTDAKLTSVAGTTDQVNVSGSTGAVTFSLPQSIATTSAVHFETLLLDALANSPASNYAFAARQTANSRPTIIAQRQTETSPTGDFLSFYNAASTPAKLFNVDISGNITVGSYQATAIADAYISSASAWNSKVGSVINLTPTDAQVGNIYSGVSGTQIQLRPVTTFNNSGITVTQLTNEVEVKDNAYIYKGVNAIGTSSTSATDLKYFNTSILGDDGVYIITARIHGNTAAGAYTCIREISYRMSAGTCTLGTEQITKSAETIGTFSSPTISWIVSANFPDLTLTPANSTSTNWSVTYEISAVKSAF
jgi:hypothetical protein